jgi:hypothetical protein
VGGGGLGGVELYLYSETSDSLYEVTKIVNALKRRHVLTSEQ